MKKSKTLSKELGTGSVSFRKTENIVPDMETIVLRIKKGSTKILVLPEHVGIVRLWLRNLRIKHKKSGKEIPFIKVVGTKGDLALWKKVK